MKRTLISALLVLGLAACQSKQAEPEETAKPTAAEVEAPAVEAAEAAEAAAEKVEAAAAEAEAKAEAAVEEAEEAAAVERDEVTPE